LKKNDRMLWMVTILRSLFPVTATSATCAAMPMPKAK
jgi:hypothetical protein